MKVGGMCELVSEQHRHVKEANGVLIRAAMLGG